VLRGKHFVLGLLDKGGFFGAAPWVALMSLSCLPHPPLPFLYFGPICLLPHRLVDPAHQFSEYLALVLLPVGLLPHEHFPLPDLLRVSLQVLHVVSDFAAPVLGHALHDVGEAVQLPDHQLQLAAVAAFEAALQAIGVESEVALARLDVVKHLLGVAEGDVVRLAERDEVRQLVQNGRFGQNFELFGVALLHG